MGPSLFSMSLTNLEVVLMVGMVVPEEQFILFLEEE